MSDAIGVKLIAASLARHAPQWPVLAYLSEPLRSTIEAQLKSIHPNLRVLEYRGPENWSCKPAVLLQALADAPGMRLLWLDVDILVVGDPSPLARVDNGTLIIAEESNPNDNALVARRQEVLGMESTPPRETTISSCVIGVTEAERPMLTRWQALMQHEAFLREQALPVQQRHLFFGDQEVWELVVCEASNRARPAYWLTNDSQMVQGTYTAHRRAAMPVRDHAMFVHATGNLKPWRGGARRSGQEMFPYFWQAKPYLHVLTAVERAHFAQLSGLAWIWRHFLGGFNTYRAARRLMNRLR